MYQLSIYYLKKILVGQGASLEAMSGKEALLALLHPLLVATPLLQPRGL